MVTEQNLSSLISPVKIVITDNDGVLTDTGVYYSAAGEELKRYSVRDGMGVERLKNELNIDTMIVTGENSASLIKRAAKLNITGLYLSVKNKLETIADILAEKNIGLHETAYIGDDYNDLAVLKKVGFSACPADAMPLVTGTVHYICRQRGGYGAFREFAELIIHYKNSVQ